jgi:tRNA(Ile)-lysidine synthase TilS/MesJ
MLKSFKRYLRESSDDEEQVLRDLLTSGLISKSEYVTLAKESGIPLQSEDFEWRYKVTLGVRMRHNLPLEEINIDQFVELVADSVSTVDQSLVSDVQFEGSEGTRFDSEGTRFDKHSLYYGKPLYKFILTIASDLAEEDLDTAIQQALYGHSEIDSVLTFDFIFVHDSSLL